MKEYCVVFSSDKEIKEGTLVENIRMAAAETEKETKPVADTDTNDMHINGIIRPMPSKMVHSAYNFDSYVNGVAKGNNYVIDKLHGGNGEYEDVKKHPWDQLLKCADIVCMDCHYGNDDTCKKCPVRMTLDEERKEHEHED